MCVDDGWFVDVAGKGGEGLMLGCGRYRGFLVFARNLFSVAAV